jgi:bacterioferritin-associated ferredoxin
MSRLTTGEMPDFHRLSDIGALNPNDWAGHSVIVCQCTAITDRDIEVAVADIISRPNAPLPTPGLVFRHLSKRMNCCTCAPLTIRVIYDTIERLAATGRVCPFASAEFCAKLIQLETRKRRYDAARTAHARQPSRTAA